MQSDGLTTSP